MSNRETIPDNCPNCDHHLVSSYFLAPKPRWQWSAILLIVFGAIISGGLIMLTFVDAANVVGRLVNEIGGSLGRKERREWGLLIGVIWIGEMMLAFLPALGLGLLASRIPKILAMKCRKCGWSQSFRVSRYRSNALKKNDPETNGLNHDTQ